MTAVPYAYGFEVRFDFGRFICYPNLLHSLRMWVNNTGICMGRYLSSPCSRESTSRLDMVGRLMTTTTRTLTTDTALRLLADQQRRKVLRHVADGNGTTTADQLVDSLFTDTSPLVDQGPTRDQLAINLHHIHLPMLEEAGVIEYPPESEAIQYRSIDIVEELLQVCGSR